MNLPSEPGSSDQRVPPSRSNDAPCDEKRTDHAERGGQPSPVKDGLVLGLMSKYWTPGEVKTRLGASIGMDVAAKLHRLFTLHLCAGLRMSATRSEVVLAPDNRVGEARNELARAGLGNSWTVVPQGVGDLGLRMRNWFEARLALHATPPKWGPQRAILIGADCPTLDHARLRQADRLLQTHDLVIGPANDGGYYLIGLRGPWREGFEPLFREMPWSSDAVKDLTLKRADEAGLSLAMLPHEEDIDTWYELKRLIDRISAETPCSENPERSGNPTDASNEALWRAIAPIIESVQPKLTPSTGGSR